MWAEENTIPDRIEYPCGCWYLFDVADPHKWKVIDYVICDDHVMEALSKEEQK